MDDAVTLVVMILGVLVVGGFLYWPIKMAFGQGRPVWQKVLGWVMGVVILILLRELLSPLVVRTLASR